MKIKESDALLYLFGLKKIINIFLTTFLTAYFVKESATYLTDISIYYIFCFLFLGLFTFLLGYIIKSKIPSYVMRIGIILFFVLISTIVLLKQNMVHYLPLLGFLYGLASSTYHYPYNLYLSEKIENHDRADYEFKKKTLGSVISIVVPVALGSLITTTSFIYTALIILLVCVMEIILSMYITPMKNRDKYFTPLNSLKRMWKDKEVKAMLLTDFFRGINIGDGALNILSTILIFNAFKTDLNLGIITSISWVLIILTQLIYTKYLKNKDDRPLILISVLIPCITIILLLFIRTNVTYILYYLGYNVFTNLVLLLIDVRLYNVSNSSLIRKTDRMEFWSIREVFLNLGRILSYVLLLVVAIINPNFLYYLLIILSLSILIMGYFLTKITQEN